jgi:protein-tyrosine phosphatase
MKILFVCLGNICRSPMAEAIFRDMAKKENLIIEVDSAGTSGWHTGYKPHKGTRKILDQLSISYEGMEGRGLSTADYYEFDYLIGMDNQNVKDMLLRAPKGTQEKVHLFLDILEDHKGQDVPDPYHTGDFNETRDLVTKASRAWIKSIQKTLTQNP